ncbi:pleckstrin homology domain-containing family M member 1-like isoform X2 [Crotalus tigris]|uniref:pleckstrin homology domain-containing family M member 1-like isoform X2 n=1 Tax=Crotalus tigris TaxID=88082 RepID=UPI00192F3050|nr:pleckstrin homology domain-containing family M member 1-like isoform X2 [Crotalus tigris]XP_039179006.1 pleckstrin homology domain-containing family M member 1-like isoform X2 [Crotalus tigris]
MQSNHTTRNGCRVQEVMQLIKKQLVNSIKALQKHYVTSDALVPSDDQDANTLCCVLEAVFVHGLKTKHIKAEIGAKGRKHGGRLPQPVFWTLLKSVTHRNIISELENLIFINTDVGRCRAWLRLALNDGLMECYLKLLLHEKSQLFEYYHSSALLLDTEEVEFLLSYLQGLSSLAFDLSYKSAVLNEWTITPLSLSGLCPAWELLDPLVGLEPQRKESLSSLSQSSGSDEVEAHPAILPAPKSDQADKLTASNLSISTTGSSQLSSSLDSDILLPANSTSTHSPAQEKEPISNDSEVEMTTATADLDQDLQEVLAEFTRTQRKLETVGVHEAHIISQSSPPECPCPATSFCTVHRPHTVLEKGPVDIMLPAIMINSQLPNLPKTGESVSSTSVQQTSMLTTIIVTKKPVDVSQIPCNKRGAKSRTDEVSGYEGSLPGTDQLLSPISPVVCPKRSWITEDDFYLPSPPEETEKSFSSSPSTSRERLTSTQPAMPLRAPDRGKLSVSSAELSKLKLSPRRELKGFSVVHRREIGLSNPFRGLLKLGTLERRGALGIWKEFFCELSPLELRLFVDCEERVCVENYSLLRCESLGRAHSDGRFELVFSNKRLCLRASSRDEAEDWLDRLHEALKKFRLQKDEGWKTLECPEAAEDSEDFFGGGPPGDLPSFSVYSRTGPTELDWSCALKPELDAVKESVLYLEVEKAWVPLVFSLSLEALKCFKARNDKKILSNSFGIETIQDILPDVNLGGPSFFKIITSKAVLKLRAENTEEATDWRDLVRRVLMSYLEVAEEALTLGGHLDGSSQAILKNTVKENGYLLQYLVAIPMEKGLDCQSFICAGCSRQIGFYFVKPKLCSFTGLYFCDNCHQDEESVIPSRLIHNWDLSRYPA